MENRFALLKHSPELEVSPVGGYANGLIAQVL
jgi:hypothetical protein